MLLHITQSLLCVSLIFREHLFNSEPSVIALKCCNPNIPQPDNASLICTLETIISHHFNCLVLGGFINWAAHTVGFQLLNISSDSLLHQCVLTPARFRVNQHISFQELFLLIPTSNIFYQYSSSSLYVRLYLCFSLTTPLIR